MKGHNSTCRKCAGQGGFIFKREEAYAATMAAGTDVLPVPVEDVIAAFRDAEPEAAVVAIECPDCGGTGERS